MSIKNRWEQKRESEQNDSSFLGDAGAIMNSTPVSPDKVVISVQALEIVERFELYWYMYTTTSTLPT